MKLDGLKKMIDEAREYGVDFGHPGCDLSPTDARVRETELLLGCKLPPSYLWFVRNYGGGEINGEEIFSIYPTLSDRAIGDVSYQSEWARSRGFVNPEAVVVSTTDFGEYFYLDPSMTDQDGELSVIIKVGNTTEVYADSFEDFLRKRISVLCADVAGGTLVR